MLKIRKLLPFAFLVVRDLAEIYDKYSKSNPLSTYPGLVCVYVVLSDATWNSTMYLQEHEVVLYKAGGVVVFVVVQ